jgi:hypothetical protein
MTERRKFVEYQPEADTESLERFDTNLRLLRNAGDLSSAFQNYIDDELKLNDPDAAAAIVNELRTLEIIPTYDAVTDSDEELLSVTESYRLAIFKAILPLYQANRTTNELGGWLPSALETVVPYDSRHSKDICDYVGDDTSCAYGQCPIKIIAKDVEQLLEQPDFNEYSYLWDNRKTYRTTNLLFERAVARGFIAKDREKRLSHSYQNAYDEYFSANR